MRTKTRALSVEPVEDRSLPSTTFVFVEPAFSYRPYGDSNGHSKFAEVRGWQARTYQAESFIRVRFSDDSVLVIRETPTGFRLIPINFGNTYNPPADTPTPPPAQGPIADGATSSTGGAVQGNNGGSTPVASSGPVRNAGALGTALGEVAIAPTTDSTPAAQPVNATQNAAAAAAAQQVTTPTNPAAVSQATPSFNGRAAYAITAIVPDAADGSNAVPPPATAPAPAPAPAPVPDGGVASDLIQVAAAALPVAGLVPLDLTALQAGAGQFLDRVADLAPEWPDAMPGFTDSLWVAAGVLLAGGVIHAARTRTVPRPARDPLASALSEWERRNGRAAG